MATAEDVTGRAPGERRHGWWILGIWLPLTVAADLVIWYFWQPHLPPGDMTTSSKHQQFDIAVMAMMGAPVVLAVWTYSAYALITWRHRAGDEEDGPPIHGHTAFQATWIIGTAVIVLSLFVFGTVELILPAGAGAGQGPAPIWKPVHTVTNTSAWSPGTHNTLVVQVIGQEWYFTYRFPQFGGMESAQLLLPNGVPVEFDVTSLDVIHSFWAYQLGVKADANPLVNNVAYTRTQQMGKFTVRCNELCGIWHGAMFNFGRVVTRTAFQAWASGLQSKEASSGLLAALPPYATTYDPDQISQLGSQYKHVLQITGAEGYYYPPPPQDPVPG
jgi:cytochrome c oxidase subunit II